MLRISEEAAYRAYPLHDGVVHVCVLPDAPLVVGTPGMGHVLL